MKHKHTFYFYESNYWKKNTNRLETFNKSTNQFSTFYNHMIEKLNFPSTDFTNDKNH